MMTVVFWLVCCAPILIPVVYVLTYRRLVNKAFVEWDEPDWIIGVHEPFENYPGPEEDE